MVGIVVPGTFAFVYLNVLVPNQETAETMRAFSPEDPEVGDLESDSIETPPRTSDIRNLDFQQLQTQSKFSRTLALWRYFARADAEVVTSFLQRSQDIVPLSLRQEAREAAVRRLGEIDPVRALLYVNETPQSVRNPLTNIVFQVWSVRNLDGAAEHASKLNEEDQRIALEGILSNVRLSRSQRLQVARQLGNEQVVRDEEIMSFAGEPIANPKTAWEEYLVEHGGDVEVLSGAQLALLRHILNSWVPTIDSTKVADVVNSALSGRGGNVSAVQMLLESWANVDPSIAFHATSEVGDEAVRTRLQRAIVAAWVELDPLDVLDGWELIPSEIQDWSKQEALVKLSETMPSEAAKRLTVISSDEVKGDVARTIATNWARLDPEAAREWILADSKIQDFRWGLMYRVVWEASKVDPEKAFEWALAEPTNERQRGRGLEQDVIRSLALQGKYETAVSMVERARDVENQSWSYVWIGNVLVRRGRSNEAWSLLEEIPERFHGLYLGQVTSNWVDAEPDRALETIESMPTKEVQEAVAVSLLHFTQFTNMLTKEQLRSLKEYMPESWQQYVE